MYRGDVSMNILEKIAMLRDERSWSNYKLAKKSKISEGTLNNLFRLGNQPTIPTLEAICSGLGITLSQFFAEGEDCAVILCKEQQYFLNMWNTLTEGQKQALMVLIKEMQRGH